jgi:hypothetical protein
LDYDVTYTRVGDWEATRWRPDDAARALLSPPTWATGAAAIPEPFTQMMQGGPTPILASVAPETQTTDDSDPGDGGVLMRSVPVASTRA